MPRQSIHCLFFYSFHKMPKQSIGCLVFIHSVQCLGILESILSWRWSATSVSLTVWSLIYRSYISYVYSSKLLRGTWLGGHMSLVLLTLSSIIQKQLQKRSILKFRSEGFFKILTFCAYNIQARKSYASDSPPADLICTMRSNISRGNISKYLHCLESLLHVESPYFLSSILILQHF